MSEADPHGSEQADAQASTGSRAKESGKQEGERSWRNLLELDARLFEQRGIRLLTPEARVLINLKLNGTMTVTTAMQMAGVSYRGFYAVLERLKQAGLVGQAKDEEDQRVRKLSLDPSMPSMPVPPDTF